MKLASQVSGSGRPLVILHGLFGSARNWAAVGRALADSYELHVLDARNHGASPHSDSMTYQEMAGDLRESMTAEGLKGAAVMGHSMGGKIAMTLALQEPDMIGALIVADIAPVAYRPHHGELIKAMQETDLAGLTRRAEAEQRLAERVADAPTRAFLTSDLVRVDGGLAWPFNLDAIDAGLEDLSAFPEFNGARYDGPALFLTGGRSDYVKPAYHDTIRRLFPAARMATIPDAGHWLHAERRDAFVAEVRKFLEESF